MNERNGEIMEKYKTGKDFQKGITLIALIVTIIIY